MSIKTIFQLLFGITLALLATAHLSTGTAIAYDRTAATSYADRWATQMGDVEKF